MFNRGGYIRRRLRSLMAEKHRLSKFPKHSFCQADKKNRVISFYVREGFGNGYDSFGLKLMENDAELKEAIKTFEDAVGCITGSVKSVVPVERWCHVKYEKLKEIS